MNPQGQQPPLLQRLEWVKSLLELVLLVLALPWILYRLWRDGARALRDLGESNFS
jgi:flagellar biogenesis protein FliO